MWERKGSEKRGKKREMTLCGKVWMWIGAYWLTVFVIVVVIVAFSGDDVVFVDGAVVAVVLKESNSYFFLHPFSSFLVIILGHFSFFLFSRVIFPLPASLQFISFFFPLSSLFPLLFFFCPFSLNESKPNRNRFMKPAYVDM